MTKAPFHLTIELPTIGDMTIETIDGFTLVRDLAHANRLAEAVTSMCLDRIAERDGLIGAWAYLDPMAAISQARARDHAGRPGPLHGLPIGIKDVILTQDMPTRYNCALYDGARPSIDASCVALLRQAGAVILGKTETVELAAIGRVARTRNPHALDHTPGGSSSGSAAAVADRHVPVAIGTQTGGSIIRPASFCGVWALKPTWGLVSNEGAKSFAPSLDTIGWFARSARDCRMVLDIFDPAQAPPTLGLEGRRIGIWRTAGWPRAEPATIEAMDAGIALLKREGAKVSELELGLPFTDLARAHWIIMLSEGRRAFRADYGNDPSRLHPRICAMVENDQGFSDADLRDAQEIAASARRLFDRLAAEHDAVLSPSTLGAAPVGLEYTGDLLFNGLFTLLHVPCVNLPLFRTRGGLPVGLTLSGPRYADHAVLEVAEAIERAALS